ncbi:MAG: Osmoprotectant transport system permease protein, partial [Marmoricola sp.]|jgi:osmoprotectant transport system permease protein|nr:Osmoprotectant transport system permease protein [Marmoricola sp.]
VWDFLVDRSDQVWTLAWGHAFLVALAVLLATVVGIAVAVVVTRVPRLEPVANAVSSIGLTIPSFALVGILIPLVGLGFWPALACVGFYAVFPILRNAVVGLQGVNPDLVESARGMGMSETKALVQVRLPLAWPVILAGVRVSTQMSMGVAAIAAYVLGPGFGSWIFTGLTQAGGRNGINYALSATIGVVIIALFFDLLLLALGRATISKGIRV